MWILEGDIVWTGSAWVCTFWLINPTWRWKVTNVCAYGGDCLWQDEFFNEYADDSADLIAINTTLKNGLDWPHFASCTLCDDKEGTLAARKTAFLPVFRISKRLARAVLEGLGSSTLTGHHEVYISTICARIKGCRDYTKKSEARYYQVKAIPSSKIIGCVQPTTTICKFCLVFIDTYVIDMLSYGCISPGLSSQEYGTQ